MNSLTPADFGRLKEMAQAKEHSRNKNPSLLAFLTMPVGLVAGFGAVLPLRAQTPAKPPLITVDVAATRTFARGSDDFAVFQNVVALDSGGYLTKDQLTILDRGKARPIEFFSINSTRPNVARAAPLPPGTFTNRPDRDANAPGRLTVFLLDGLNTAVVRQAYVRQQLVRYLKDIQARERVAVYALTDSLGLLHDFTNDAQSLIRAVDGYSPIGSAETGEAYRARITANAIIDLGEHLGRVSGRKNLVWLAGAFPLTLDYSDTSQEGSGIGDSRRAARALAKAHVAIYPVYTRGLAREDAMVPAPAEVMELLAGVTGGRPFFGQNTLLDEIRQAANDADVTYTLSFYPDGEVRDGSFRELSVQAKRPGLILRYPAKYLIAGKEHREAVDDAIRSPVESSAIWLTIRLEMREAASIGVSVEFPIEHIVLDALPNGRSGAFDLVIQQQAADGRELAIQAEPVKVALDAQQFQEALAQGLHSDRKLERARGVAELRFVVLDRNSGRVGSLHVKLPK
jgi:VWFA-related protein